MSTKRIVPRADGEGGIGRADKRMGSSYFSDLGLSADCRETEAVATTNDNASTTLWTSDVLSGEGEAVYVRADILCLDATGNHGGSFCRQASARRNATSSTLIGSTIIGADNIVDEEAISVSVGVSGNAIQISVTGLTGTTMVWIAFIRCIYVR